MIKCKKCGASLMLDTSIVEEMNSRIEELNIKAKTAKTYAIKVSYNQEASQIKKMITQIQHRTTQLEERKTSVTCELAEIVHYIRSNKLITDDKLSELREKGRVKAKIKNAEDQKVINQIYGEFESVLQNRSKSDPTATKALKAVKP